MPHNLVLRMMRTIKKKKTKKMKSRDIVDSVAEVEVLMSTMIAPSISSLLSIQLISQIVRYSLLPTLLKNVNNLKDQDLCSNVKFWH